MSRTVLVCRNKTCSQQGSARVLEALESGAPSDVEVKRSGCLGQCGSGPMVLVEPDETWYSQVQPGDVPAIVSQHLKGGRAVKKKLYRTFHPQETSAKGWFVVGGILFALVALLFGMLLIGQTAYL